MKINTVYTIGHSTHTIDEFVRILKLNGINSVCDVRTSPYSKFVPQFNKEQLKRSLKENNIDYLEFGKEFGARRTDPKLIDNGIVNFKKVAQDESFQSGVERVKNGLSKGYKMALMCSEKNPVECHRNVLVSRNLAKLGIEIIHILGNGSTISNSELENEMIKEYLSNDEIREFYRKKQYPVNIFGEILEPNIQSTIEKEIGLIELAYEKANKKIGFRSIEEEE